MVIPAEQQIKDTAQTIMGGVLSANEEVIASISSDMTEEQTVVEHLSLIRAEKRVLAEQRARLYPKTKQRGDLAPVKWIDFLFHTAEDMSDNLIIGNQIRKEQRL